MHVMPMRDAMMPSAWMPMCGQSWLGAAACFLGMWSVMMAAMMLPSLVPMLWRYRQAAARAGETRLGLLTILLGGGYLLVWSLLGAVVYPLGAGLAAVATRDPALARAAPAWIALIVLIAGAVQLTRWKARHLACCRKICGCESLPRSGGPSARAFTALRQGLRLGWHCNLCCAGLTTILIVSGLMDWPVMLAVTAGVTLERLAPGGERAARAIGFVVIGAGLLLGARAAGLS